MSASLEELLRAAAAKGLTHLSVHPTDSTDGKTTYWRASATPSTQHRYVDATGTDIVEVVTRVLTELPAAKRRAVPKKDVTVMVTNEPGEPLSGMPAGTDPLDLHDAFGDMDKWLPKT